MINLNDIRIESSERVYKGGQHVGIPNPGVKVTHIPTGISATCDCQRSQMQNRNVALSMIEWGLSEIGYKEVASLRRLNHRS